MINETPRIYYLYKITNLKNDKIYIGQSVNPRSRWYQHKSDAAKDKPIMVITQAIKKHGNENFDFEVIACCQTLDDVNELETLLVNQYRSHISTGKGYNVSFGGMNAPKSEEWKQYMSGHMSGLWEDPEYKSRMIQAFQNRTPEEQAETSKLKSEIFKGRHLSPETEYKEGHQFSPETLQKMSESKMGCVSWNTGTIGVMKPNQTSFQPGHITWNKGTHITTSSSFQAGANHRLAKLTEEQVLQIVQLDKQGMKKQEIADMFGVKLTSIHGIVGGRRRNHITGFPKAK